MCTRPRKREVWLCTHFNPKSNLKCIILFQIHMSMAQGPSDQPQWHHTFLLPDCQLNQSVAIVLFHMSQINQDEVNSFKNTSCALSTDNYRLSALPIIGADFRPPKIKNLRTLFLYLESLINIFSSVQSCK